MSSSASYKTGHSPSDTYFSTPGYSIPVSTPYLASSYSAPPTSHHPSSSNRAPEHEMINAFASQFPAAPSSLSIPARRQPAPDTYTPRIVTSHRSTSLSETRQPIPAATFPSMNISSSSAKHVFRVQLPQTIESGMITISANKGDRLMVVADAWHTQSDYHYEWQIYFAPRDSDLSAVQARHEPNGNLTIDVRRISGLVVSIMEAGRGRETVYL